MDIKIYSAFLPHDDRDAAVAFYCDTLGFELRNDVGYNGMHWLTVGPAGQPDVNVVLFPLVLGAISIVSSIIGTKTSGKITP